MRLNAKQVAHCTGGSFVVDAIDASELLTGVTWDSREVQPGWLFVALPGGVVDGHEFVGNALQSGARAALVMAPVSQSTRLLASELGAAIIEVPSTAAALRDLAEFWRGKLGGTVIGVTGSSGKTTTKNLIRDVLAARGSVVATKGNQNNELGVPRTLLAAEAEMRHTVVEMGMRGAGQLADLCRFVRPQWGVITLVGESHIELLGSQEAIMRAKAELVEALPAGTGVAFLNADCPFTPQIERVATVERRGVSVVLFSATADPRTEERRCAVWATDALLDAEGCASFVLHAAGFPQEKGGEAAAEEAAPVRLQLRGLHNVSNAAAAAAVGKAAGLSLAAIAEALGSSLPEAGRQEVLAAPAGFRVINDAYNANPESMRAALSAFARMNVRGRRFAVLGDMAELGSFGPACHAGIGRLVAELPIDELVCIGTLARRIADAALEAGVPPSRVHTVSSNADALAYLEPELEADDAVLVKASHCMNLNRIVEGLVN